MGSGAAGSAYTEMINAGYSKNQARAYAALVGGSEAGLSYLFSGIGKLGGKVTGNVVSKLVDKAAQAYLPYINDIVKNAVLLDSYASDSGKTKSPNSLLMHSMYAVADIGKGPEVLKLYVEEMNDPNKSTTVKRAYQIQNIEKASAVNGGVQGGTSSSLANTANAVYTVADLFAAVKAKDTAFQPKTAQKTANGKVGWDGRVVVEEATGPKVTVGGKTYVLLGYDENGSKVYQDAEVLKEQEKQTEENNSVQAIEEKGFINLEEYDTMNLNRQSKNTGAFADLPERMSKKHIRRLAKEYGVSLDGVSLNIDTNQELLRIGLTGVVDPEHIGGITFLPNAFRSKEELLRTLFHEKVHVKQFREFGVEYVQNNRAHFEELAYAEENEFIQKLKKAGKL